MIEKYINSKYLEEYQDLITSWYECDYGIQNYNEYGDKTSYIIYLDYVKQSIYLLEDEEKDKCLKLFNYLEENEIDFIIID